MLKQTPPSAPRPASATHDDIIERALQLIKPKPEQTAEARKRVVFIIDWVTFNIALDTALTSACAPPTNREIDKFADALRATIAALEHPMARGLVIGKLNPDDLLRLRTELGSIVEAAVSTRKKEGPRAKMDKRIAAAHAYLLLHQFGRVEPTLYKDGAFLQLAALLYEGATGIAGADFSRACKWAVFWENKFRQLP
jgi:hypothetical protein